MPILVTGPLFYHVNRVRREHALSVVARFWTRLDLEDLLSLSLCLVSVPVEHPCSGSEKSSSGNSIQTVRLGVHAENPLLPALL